MCDLCSSDPTKRDAAREDCYRRAKEFERMAALERSLGSGHAIPHVNVESGRSLARTLIRYLVEEWM
jgi:hypothetical protein